MKHLTLVTTAILAMAVFLSGCATAQVNLSATPLAATTHADLQNAAAIATKNGYPARAAVWTALDAQFTACENAISSAIPVMEPMPASAGPAVFSRAEIAAEVVGAGIPASVKINCTAFPVVPFPLPLK